MFYRRIIQKKIVLGLLLSMFLVGCGGVLPTKTSINQSTFSSFGEVKQSYDKIEPGKTSHAELHMLGFDPESTPNVSILNYVDVVTQFGAVYNKADLPEGVKACMQAGDACIGYVAQIEDIKHKRIGSVPADLFGFRKNVKITGWRFKATIVIVDNVVTYKLWNGTPEIEAVEKEVKPLGPLQNMSGAIPRPI